MIKTERFFGRDKLDSTSQNQHVGLTVISRQMIEPVCFFGINCEFDYDLISIIQNSFENVRSQNLHSCHKGGLLRQIYSTTEYFSLQNFLIYIWYGGGDNEQAPSGSKGRTDSKLFTDKRTKKYGRTNKQTFDYRSWEPSKLEFPHHKFCHA